MTKTRLDAADVRILSALQAHGPLSKAKLADLVNLSPTPCWTRLDRLKRAGLVRGFHADIALDEIADVTQVVVTVSLNSHRKADFERFEARVLGLQEVTHCVATGGGMDYVMTVVTPTLKDFQALMEDLLAEDLAIERYMTYIATRTIKSAQPDIAHLATPQPR